MVDTRIKPIVGQSRQIALNHNDIDGKRWVSYAQKGGKWATVNSEVGGLCVKLLDFSGIAGLISDYFFCFQDQENWIVKLIANSFNAMSGAAFGYREERKYVDIYSKGINTVDKNDLKDQDKVRKKVAFMDDFLENAIFLKDDVINFFWKLSTNVSQISAPVFFLAPFLGKKWSDSIFSLFQTPTRGAWRLTFLLAPVFHGNFVQTMCKLPWVKFKSLFGSESARKESDNFFNNLESMANKYANLTYGNTSGLNNKKGLKAYLWMLGDRLYQHKRGISNPDVVLEEKVQRGNLERADIDDRTIHPDKSIAYGYTIPGQKEDQDIQKNASIVTYTAFPCAVIGILGTFVFEPIRCVMDLANIERGKNLITCLANLRGPASLFNYLYKFFLPEKIEGEKYKLIESHMKTGTTNEAIEKLYAATKGRYVNSYFGFTILGASLIDSFGQLVRSFAPENRTQNFLFAAITRYVGVGFTRYFSARRRDLGETDRVLLACKKILGRDILTYNEKDLKDIMAIDDAQFNAALESLSSQYDVDEEEKTERFYGKPMEQVAGMVGGLFEKLMAA